jgi:hypothetical protein
MHLATLITCSNLLYMITSLQLYGLAWYLTELRCTKTNHNIRELSVSFSDLLRTGHLIQSAMMLERLSRETVFGYEESVITATHSDAIAWLPPDQVNGSPATGRTVSQYLSYVPLTDRAKFTDFEHKIRRAYIPKYKYRCHILFKGTDLTHREYIEYCNGFDQSIARQQLCKHVHTCNNRGMSSLLSNECGQQ